MSRIASMHTAFELYDVAMRVKLNSCQGWNAERDVENFVELVLLVGRDGKRVPRRT